MNEALIWLWDNTAERVLLWWDVFVRGYRVLPASSDSGADSEDSETP